MALPALQVRVPNPANALLQAEQIKGARSQNQLFQQQQAGQNALLTAFQGNDFRTSEGRNAIVGQVAQAAPLQALALQQQFGQLSAQEQAQTARESQIAARVLVGVRDQATYDQARTVLQQNGVDISDMPSQFDPGFVQSAIQVAQSIDSLTVNASTAAQIQAADQRAAAPTPALSDARQQQELAQIAARQTPAKPPLPVATVRLQEARDVATREGRLADAAQLQAEIDAKAFGRTPQDVGTEPGQAESVAAGVAAREEARDLASFSTVLGEFERIGPGAAGLRAQAAELGGGLLGQLNQTVGDEFSKFVGGAPAAEIASIRQRARIVVAQQLSQITGEQSGRFTEPERAIAEEASKVLEGEASFEQIRGAMSTAIAIKYVARDFNEQISGIPPRFDLTTEAGQTTALIELLALNLTPQEAVTAINQLAEQRRLVTQSGGRTPEEAARLRGEVGGR